MQPRMNRRDNAELTELVTNWKSKKRNLVPKGYKLIVWTTMEKIEPSPTVEIRIAGKPNGLKVPRTGPTKKRMRKLKGDVKAIAAMPLAKLDLSTAVYNKIINSGGLATKTIGDLYRRINDLYLIPNFGSRSIKECRDKLAAVGLVD